jgi:hypothetical protein
MTKPHRLLEPALTFLRRKEHFRDDYCNWVAPIEKIAAHLGESVAAVEECVQQHPGRLLHAGNFPDAPIIINRVSDLD